MSSSYSFQKKSSTFSKPFQNWYLSASCLKFKNWQLFPLLKMVNVKVNGLWSWEFYTHRSWITMLIRYCFYIRILLYISLSTFHLIPTPALALSFCLILVLSILSEEVCACLNSKQEWLIHFADTIYLCLLLPELLWMKRCLFSTEFSTVAIWGPKLAVQRPYHSCMYKWLSCGRPNPQYGKN